MFFSMLGLYLQDQNFLSGKISSRASCEMSSSITRMIKQFVNNPAADKKCHKSCLSKILNSHGSLMFRDSAGVYSVLLALWPKYFNAGIQNDKVTIIRKCTTQLEHFNIGSPQIIFIVQQYAKYSDKLAIHINNRKENKFSSNMHSTMRHPRLINHQIIINKCFALLDSYTFFQVSVQKL